MKRFSWILTLLVIALLNASATVFAQQIQYVNDVVYVPLRSGPSSQHRILHKGLKSGTALELIESNEDNSWMHVKVSDELEGWIPTHYLTDIPVAALQLQKAESELAKLRQSTAETSQENKGLSTDLKSLRAEVQKLEEERTQLAAELNRVRSVYSGAIELDSKYQELIEKHELLRTQNNALSAENENLKSDQRISFMFYGGCLVILGMLAIVILPRLQPKKRHSDWIN